MPYDVIRSARGCINYDGANAEHGRALSEILTGCDRSVKVSCCDVHSCFELAHNLGGVGRQSDIAKDKIQVV